MYILTANPRGSRTLSADPLDPFTVENRTYAGVTLLVSVKIGAEVRPVKGVCSLNSPNAPAPRAWTTRSGIRSWSKCEIFSRLWESADQLDS